MVMSRMHSAYFSASDRLAQYAKAVWESHTLEKGPRKGNRVFKNTLTGEIRDTVPTAREATNKPSLSRPKGQKKIAPKKSTPQKPTAKKKTPRLIPQKKMNEKALRAQASATRVDSEIQRYAEEHNEPIFAKSIGGLSFKDNEPVDVVVGVEGVIKHGIELKTMVSNKAGKITMKRSAMDRKTEWEKANKATFHTCVIDDHAVFNAKGPGQHDESKRVLYYRRGFGSFRVATMYRVKNIDELKKLLAMSNEELPAEAKRPTAKAAVK
jgi:hypothetical protein